jgi:uncharacterized protein YggE
MQVRALAAVATLTLATAPVAAADGPSTLSVDGAGAVQVTPDVATFTVSVSRAAATPRAALSATNRAGCEWLDAVRLACADTGEPGHRGG